MSPAGFSKDGKYFVYFLKVKGSDWDDAIVRDTETKKDIDRVKWLKFTGIQWTEDSKGFFYSTFDPPKNQAKGGKETEKLKDNKVYYHRLGTPQSKD